MNKHRWYKTEWGIPLSKLKKELAARRFAPDGFDGFLLTQTREDLVAGSYVERLVRTETVVDPFGRQSSFERVEYRKSEFVVSGGRSFNLELINPNRSASRLISRFLEASNYQFVLINVIIDPISWAENSARLLNRQFHVEALTAGNISIGSGVSGELSVKGPGDVLEAATSMLSDKKYQVEKIKLQFEGIVGTVILSSSGMLATNSDSTRAVVDCAREAINLSQSH